MRKFLLLALLLVPAFVMAQEEEKAQQVKKLEITADVGAIFGVQKGGSAGLTVTAGVGSWLDKHFYLGAHTGAFIGLKKGSTATIPLFARMEYKFNGNKTAGLSLPFDVGYIFRAKSIMLGLMPTYTFVMNSWSNLKFGVGYIGAVSTQGYGMGHNLGARIGWQFHPGKATPRINPTRDSGLQYTIETGLITTGTRCISGGDTYKENYPEIAFGVALTYKYNPNLSFGVVYRQENENNTFALRGNYRLSDKKGSWIGSADVGLTKKNYYAEGTSGFIAPAVGYSVRAAGNSYFDFKLGYRIGSSVSEKATTGEEFKALNNGIFFTISWTHTTKLFQR